MQYRIFVFQYLWVRLRLRLEGTAEDLKHLQHRPQDRVRPLSGGVYT
jgi:hypothetical protein